MTSHLLAGGGKPDDDDSASAYELRPSEAQALAPLLRQCSDAETEALLREPSDEFSIAQNLALYRQIVEALARGALYVVEDLEAMCAYREDLDAALGELAIGELRDRLVDFVDDLDRTLLDATVPGTPPWRRPPESDAWWWVRVPRRTDQRRFLRDEWRRPRSGPVDR